MGNNTALDVQTAAYEKARLISEARDILIAANRMDERDDLNLASFAEWYDRTIPEVRDIKVVTGAMEIMLMLRRGERVIAEGERRGRPEKVTSPVTLMSHATKMQRSRERKLAAEPVAVETYVLLEVTAGRLPSVFGALRAAAAMHPKPARGVRLFEAQQKRAEQFNRDIIAILDQLADGKRRSDPQINKILGNTKDHRFIGRVRLIPWLKINRTIEGTIFHIDKELRAICEDRRSRPELPNHQSISDYLRDLRTEITRRRKSNNDEFQKRRWNHEVILKREQTSLLDWIEQQLDRLPTL